jgi:regulator of sigma E protease
VREKVGDPMNEVFGSIWWLIVTIGVLVTFHEFGHFWVARRCGVKVIAFSVGFGRAIWSRKDKHGTIFQIAMIPLGGYVKMLDERDQDVSPAERPLAFNQQSVGKRIAIVAAGPIANLILCFVFYWAMFVVGKPDQLPVIGPSAGITAQAGLIEGDRLLNIDGKAVSNWSNTIPALMLAAIDRRDVDVVYERSPGKTEQTVLALSQLPEGFDQSRALYLIGIIPIHTNAPALVTAVQKDGAADGVLKVGDRILSIGNTATPRYVDLQKAVKAQSPSGSSLKVRFERNQRVQEVFIKPNIVYPELSFWQNIQKMLGAEVPQGEPSWLLGIGYQPPQATFRHGPIEAIGEALKQTWRSIRDTFAILKRLIVGQASVKNVSGTITVAQVANQEANASLGAFLGFLAYFSLSLCIMNLLPIPVLDGGHLLYYFVELITGSPVAERVQMAGQMIGLTMLASLMILAHYNDVARIFSF